MMQIPNLPNPYMQVAQPQPQSYNAVKIDVHNPSVIAPGYQQVPVQKWLCSPDGSYVQLSGSSGIPISASSGSTLLHAAAADYGSAASN